MSSCAPAYAPDQPRDRRFPSLYSWAAQRPSVPQPAPEQPRDRQFCSLCSRAAPRPSELLPTSSESVSSQFIFLWCRWRGPSDFSEALRRRTQHGISATNCSKKHFFTALKFNPKMLKCVNLKFLRKELSKNLAQRNGDWISTSVTKTTIKCKIYTV